MTLEATALEPSKTIDGASLPRVASLTLGLNMKPLGLWEQTLPVCVSISTVIIGLLLCRSSAPSAAYQCILIRVRSYLLCDAPSPCNTDGSGNPEGGLGGQNPAICAILLKVRDNVKHDTLESHNTRGRQLPGDRRRPILRQTRHPGVRIAEGLVGRQLPASDCKSMSSENITCCYVPIIPSTTCPYSTIAAGFGLLSCLNGVA